MFSIQRYTIGALFFASLCLVGLSGHAQDAMDSLRSDFKVADVVAHVNVVEMRLVDRTTGADCENEKGVGYCAYRLTAEVRDIFKGQSGGVKFEFIATSEASYPKRNFMGAKVVFLIYAEARAGRPRVLATIENSSRPSTQKLLGNMRLIVDGVGAIDETDADEPYSAVSLRSNFERSVAVVLAEVTSFAKYEEELGTEPFIVTATVKEVFKGSLRSGENIQYKDDLLYRPMRSQDLGLQVLFLEKPWPSSDYTITQGGRSESRKTNPKAIQFKRIQSTEGRLIHNILEKLRTLKKGQVGVRRTS